MKTVQLHVPVSVLTKLQRFLVSEHVRECDEQSTDNLDYFDGLESFLVDVEDEMVENDLLDDEDRYFGNENFRP